MPLGRLVHIDGLLEYVMDAIAQVCSGEFFVFNTSIVILFLPQPRVQLNRTIYLFITDVKHSMAYAVPV